MYSVAQRVVLPLIGGVLAPALSALTLRWSRRRLQERESSESRAFLFYNALSGVLLGQFVSHTALLVERLDARIMHACALVGFVLMYVAETEGRLWNASPGYVPPMEGQADVDEDSNLDKGRMELRGVVRANDVASDAFANVVFDSQALGKDESKRVWMLVALLGMLAVVLTMDGLLMVYRAPVTNHAATVACFALNALALSVSVYGAMLHAKYHVYEEFDARGLWRWMLLTAVWCLMLVVSAVPAVASMTLESATKVVEHYAFLCVYGVASGALLKLCFYYFLRAQLAATAQRRTIRLGLAAFAAAAAQSAVTGVWL